MKDQIFSPMETKIVKILGRSKMTIAEVSDKYFRRRKTALEERNRIGGAIRRINRKCKVHKLPWNFNGMGAGRAGKTVWRDKRS